MSSERFHIRRERSLLNSHIGLMSLGINCFLIALLQPNVIFHDHVPPLVMAIHAKSIECVELLLQVHLKKKNLLYHSMYILFLVLLIVTEVNMNV